MCRLRPLLLLHVIAVTCKVVNPYKLPDFSWDTLPVAWHSAIPAETLAAADLGVLAKYPLVTLEKTTGAATYRWDPATLKWRVPGGSMPRGLPDTKTSLGAPSVPPFPKGKVSRRATPTVSLTSSLPSQPHHC